MVPETPLDPKFRLSGFSVGSQKRHYRVQPKYLVKYRRTMMEEASGILDKMDNPEGSEWVLDNSTNSQWLHNSSIIAINGN